MTDDNQLEIFTVPNYNANAYIMEIAGNGCCEFLWTAPLFKDNTVDNTQWSIVEDDQIINDVLDISEKTIINKISSEEFVNLLK